MNWSHNGAPFGRSDSELYWDGTTSDAGDIKLTSDPGTDNLVYASSASDQRSMTKRFADSDMPVGTYMCRSGQTTGWTCGHVSAIDQTVNPGPEHYTIKHQWKVDFGSNLGDSGATMMSLSTYGGIFSSLTTTESWYSTVNTITNNLGDVPCLTATC